MHRFIAPIVEGHGEVEAVQALLRRIVRDVGFRGVLRVGSPIRVRARSFVGDETYFERYVHLAAAKAAQAHGSVLILLDCEDDCPAELGPRLLSRAHAVRNDVTVVVALAYREFETWFIAAAQSLAGTGGLPSHLQGPPEPERIRDAKGWLGSRMPVPYDPVIHQLQFAKRFDLQQACTNRSFKRFYQRIAGLVLER